MTVLHTLVPLYAHRKDARRQFTKEAMEIVDQKLENLDREIGEKVMRAIVEEKLPIARIAREMGCSRTLIYQIRDKHVAVLSVAGVFDPLATRYAAVGDKVRVTLTEREARDTLEANGYHGIRTDLFSALFEQVSGRWFRVREEFEPMPVPDGYEHPVGLWARVQENGEQLAEWAAEHVVAGTTSAPATVGMMFEDDEVAA